MTKISIEKADANLILLDKEVIKTDQDKIRKSIISLDKSVHDNGVQCLMHAEKHGDTSLMRRLIVEILGVRTATTGYRTQGFINWMRKFSPMELKGDTINLSGIMTEAGKLAMIKQFPDIDQALLVVGEKRPFLVELANKTFFASDRDNDEQVLKPVYTETLVSPVLAFSKKVTDAMENTVNGKPVDASKYFFDGIHGDALMNAATQIAAIVNALPKDSTLEVRKVQARLKEDQAFLETHKVA